MTERLERALRRVWRLGLPDSGLARRSVALLAVYLLVFGGVAYRLVSVQVLHADTYAKLGAQQRSRTIDLAAGRGRIYDRNGDVIATSVTAATVYADPRAFRSHRRDGVVVGPTADPQRVAAKLAPLLDVDADTLVDRLTQKGHFVYLARQIDAATGREITQLDLDGIGVLDEPARVHPVGSLAAHVTGFTGIDGEGLAGLELHYDSLLSGRAGQLALERAPGGLTIASGQRELQPAIAGTDLVLTLDREIQHAAERVAARTVDEHDAAGASIVVLDVESGEVLAMASAPTFDPDAPGAVDPAARRNRAVTDMFEPGSTQKAITAAAAIEEGVVEPSTSFTVPDTIETGGTTFSDAHRHPTEQLTLRQIIERSSNVGTILVAQQLGSERLSAWLRKFGYGQPLGVGFPGEASGAVPPLDAWSATSLPTIAFGQGVAVTLLQMASFYGTIANDGVAVQPRLVRGTVGEDGRLSSPAPSATRRIISATTARQVRGMLATVVNNEHGTGARAAVDGYEVAGKTGTARKPREGGRGYSGNHVGSFVGFAPADDPAIAVAVMVDEPTPIYGGVVAAPAFSDVAAFALRDRHVPPDRPGEVEPRPVPPPATPNREAGNSSSDGGGDGG